MDLVDRDLEKAEREATPNRFPDNAPKSPSEDMKKAEKHSRPKTPRPSSSVASSSSSASSIHRGEGLGLSHTHTSRELERHPTHLSRIETHRTQHEGTVGRSNTTKSSKKPLPPMGAGKEYPPRLPEREEYVVEFDGPHDPLHPQNWPMRKKLVIAVVLGYTTLVAAFASSIFSAATRAVAEQFGVSTEVGILGLSLYVLGFATGPILWAPLSELRGRKLPMIISMFGFSIFSVATAVGKDLQTVFICRFWGGVFASCPLAVVAAVFSDMFDNRELRFSFLCRTQSSHRRVCGALYLCPVGNVILAQGFLLPSSHQIQQVNTTDLAKQQGTRGLAVTLFSMTVFTGPLLAPFIGGFTVMNPHLGWRWTEYFAAILGFLALGLNLFFLRETYPPIVYAFLRPHNSTQLERLYADQM